MLVDSIEAGARTIDPPEREKFEEMVQRVIFCKLQPGPARRVGPHARGPARARQPASSTRSCNVYHNRIRYPWQDAQERGEAAAARARTASPSRAARHAAHEPATREGRADVPNGEAQAERSAERGLRRRSADAVPQSGRRQTRAEQARRVTPGPARRARARSLRCGFDGFDELARRRRDRTACPSSARSRRSRPRAAARGGRRGRSSSRRRCRRPR